MLRPVDPHAPRAKTGGTTESGGSGGEGPPADGAASSVPEIAGPHEAATRSAASPAGGPQTVTSPKSATVLRIEYPRPNAPDGDVPANGDMPASGEVPPDGDGSATRVEADPSASSRAAPSRAAPDEAPFPGAPAKPTLRQRRRRKARLGMVRDAARMTASPARGATAIATAASAVPASYGRGDGRYGPATIDHGAGRPRRSVPVLLFRAIVQLALVGLVLFAGLTAMQRLLDAAPERSPRVRPPTVYTIETREAVPGDNRPTLTLYGEIAAGRSIDLRAPASGEIVSVAADLRAGLRVEAGEELLAIDDFDARSALSEARSNLAQARGQIAETQARIAAEEAQVEAAREQAELAREDFERSRLLVRRGTLPAAQLDQKRLTLSQAEQGALTRRSNLAVQRAQLETQASQIERLEFRVEQASRALADTVMTAPFSGVVRSADAVVGRTVTPADVLLSLYDDGALDARFLLTDAQYGRLATDRDPLVGRPVEIVWTVGGTPYAFEGRIERIGAEIATERGGVEVFAAVDGGGGPVTLRPGAFVEIVVPDRTFEDSIRLPETALYDERDVYVNVDGQLERRGVVRLAFDGEDVIVRPGGEAPLAAGERVMVTRLSRVDDGLSVREPGETRPDGRGRGGADGAEAREGGGARAARLRAVAEANGMSVGELRALPAEERRTLMRAYAEENGALENGAGAGNGGGRPARGLRRGGV